MPEQLTFENAFGQGRNVQRHEGLALTMTVLMQGPGHQLLSRAVLTLNQHGAVGGSDLLQQ